MSRFGRLATGSTLLLLAGLCFWSRTQPAFETVFATPEEPQLLGTDAHFHLRHASHAATNGLRLLRQDCGSGYPRGPANDAAGLWDVGLAAAALAHVGTAPSQDEVAAVIAWAPPVAAALTLLLLYLACRCAAAVTTSLGACALYLLYPGQSLERTVLGFADHHAAELLLATALILGLLWQTARPEVVPSWRRSLLNASPVVALTFTWRGAPLYLAAALLAVLAFCAVAGRAGYRPRSLGLGFWRYGAAATAATALLAIAFPALVLENRSFAIMLTTSAAFAGGSLLLAVSRPQGTTDNLISRRSWWLTASAILATAALLASPLGTPLRSLAWNVLSPRSTLVSEHSAVTFGSFVRLTGAAGLLAIPGMAVAAVQSWRRQLHPSALMLCSYGVLLLALWASTRDFGYVTAPLLAANAALLLAAVSRRLAAAGRWLLDLILAQRARSIGHRPRSVLAQTWAGGAVIALAVAPAWPLGVARTPRATESTVAALALYTPAWRDAMSWLDRNSPVPASTPQSCRPAADTADYGVIAPWTYGDAVAAYANRIPRWSRQPSPSIANWELATSETDSLRALCPDCQPHQAIRYAVVGASACGHRFLAMAKFAGHTLRASVNGKLNLVGGTIDRLDLGARYRDSMAVRLCADRGNGLGHYRLVYESPQQLLTLSRMRPSGLPSPAPRIVFDLLTTDPGRNRLLADRLLSGKPIRSPRGILFDARLDPEVSIYEVAPGATIQGHAPAGSSIIATLGLRTDPGNREWSYEVEARAREDGTFSLLVAYPSTPEPARSAVHATGPYRLSVATAKSTLDTKVAVRPEHVRDGSTVTPTWPD